MANIRSFKELKVWQRSMEAAVAVFELSKKFPDAEKYSFTDQIRRASQSVPSNISEAWRKRRYPNHFISKLSDSDAEAAETENWLAFARACDYLAQEPHDQLCAEYDQINRLLNAMMQDPTKWTK